MAAQTIFIGAHQESLDTVKDKQLPAVGLDPATLTTLLPNQSALLAKVQALTADLTTVTAERDALKSAVPAKPQPGGIASLAFIDRFSPAEEGAIFAAAAQNPAIMAYLIKTSAAGMIYLDSPEIVDGVNALVRAGLITQDRATVILAS